MSVVKLLQKAKRTPLFTDECSGGGALNAASNISLSGGRWVVHPRYTGATYAQMGGGNIYSGTTTDVQEFWIRDYVKPYRNCILDFDMVNGWNYDYNYLRFYLRVPKSVASGIYFEIDTFDDVIRVGGLGYSKTHSYTFAANTTYSFRVILIEHQMWVYVNDVLQFQIQQEYDLFYAKGYLGLRLRRITSTQGPKVGRIQIWSLDQEQKDYAFEDGAGPAITAALTGTITASVNETDIRDGIA